MKIIIDTQAKHNECDRMGCRNKAVKYVRLSCHGVNLCRKHAQQACRRTKGIRLTKKSLLIPMEGYFMSSRVVKIKSVQQIGSSTFVEFENKNKLDNEWSAGVKSSYFNGAQVGDRWLIKEDGLMILSARRIYPPSKGS